MEEHSKINYSDAYLGCLMLDSKSLQANISIEMLDPTLQDLYKHICFRIMDNLPIDSTSLCLAFREHDWFPGVIRVSDMPHVAVSASLARHYGEEIVRRFKLRKIKDLKENINVKIEDNPDDVISSIQEKIISINLEHKVNNQKLCDIIKEFNNLDEEIPHIKTGEETIDKAWLLDKGGLHIIAGRPGSGKSELACWLTTRLLKQGPVLFFSLEMPKFQIVKRLKHIWRGLEGHENEPLTICDRPAIPVENLMMISLMQKGVSAVIVDYLQLLRTVERYQNREQQVGYISSSLKELARKMECPVIALCQLNREVEATKTKRPLLSHLRESGCLAGETLIECDGYRTLDSLNSKELFKVKSLSESGISNQVAKKCFFSGVKQTYKLTLTTGHSIVATGNHKFLTTNGWVPLRDFKIKDDLVALSIKDNDESLDTMSESEIKFLGLFIGNGCALKNRSLQYTGNRLDMDLCRDIMVCAEKIFPGELRPSLKDQIYRGGTDRESSAVNVFFPAKKQVSSRYRNPMVLYLEKHGLYNKRAGQKSIPSEIFKQGIATRRLFLKYLWASDGTVCYSKGKKRRVLISYSTSSELLANDLQRMLQGVGIISYVHKNQRGKSTWFNVSITSKYFLSKFINEIGIAGERKGTTLELCKTKLESVVAGWTKYKLDLESNVIYVPIKSIDVGDVIEVYDIEVPETHNFIANGFVVHNSIEQDSDSVVLIYRPEYYYKLEKKPTPPGEEGLVELSIAKQRNRETGVITARWDHSDGSWTNWSLPTYKTSVKNDAWWDDE